jgi:uncharacterized protein YjbI with pentapeptide repeats
VDQQQQSRWRPTRRQLLWICGVGTALVVSILIGYRYGITLWDWLNLLVVPAVIAGGGLWFNAQQREREQRIANERAQDEALQAYLDGMSQLLTDKDRPLHKTRPGDSLSSVARARTLTVLPRLAGARKARVVQFLYESGLISGGRPVLELRGADLSGADLGGAALSIADLSQANLKGTNLGNASLDLANLRKANLSRANLRKAYLEGADLSGADLSEADLGAAHVAKAYLKGANLYHANLSKANLGAGNLIEANLIEANLSEAALWSAALYNADLSEADLSRANLVGAGLSGSGPSAAPLFRLGLSLANHDGAEDGTALLRGAGLTEADLRVDKGWTEKQLAAAKSLQGAIMPDGQKYEEWLKSKGHTEDRENTGPS